ncbi:hypothetical protein [Sorangium sp. So ce1182]|uniref:hypothetical protein n=1 Tax=Sorangium sp. So ce1182 TaxID=3133334 RepID=UPI003F5E2FBA
MMRTLVFGLSSLVLIACGPSMNAAPVEPVAGTGQAAQALSSGPRPQRPGRTRHPEPTPIIPQCGACGTYVLSNSTLYLAIDRMATMPTVSLTLYSTKDEKLETYQSLKPDLASGGRGKASYTLPWAPTEKPAWGSVQWQEQGQSQQLSVDVQSTWGGWPSRAHQ